MQLIIKPQRKDGKTPVTFIFDSGRHAKSLIPNKDYASIQAIKDKYPNIEIVYDHIY